MNRDDCLGGNKKCETSTGSLNNQIADGANRGSDKPKMAIQ
jgi:hypothetical protein